MLSLQTFLRTFQRLSAAAGLPHCRLHSIRHAHATALLEAGVPIEVVSKRLRHADISTTLSLYAHMTKKLDRSVAEQGAAILR
jgi:site-specific recombinase XerD